MPADIDKLAPTRNLIDLSSNSNGDFGLDDFVLSKVFGDIILVEFIDETEDGDNILRNGIYIPKNAATKAWRKARVILTGVDVREVSVGDIVIFPNDKGATVANLDIANHGKIKSGMFLNEQRLFGICTPKEV